MLLEIALGLAVSHQQKPEKIALVFGPDPVRIEIVRTSEAEDLYAKLKPKHDAGTLTEQEAKEFAAVNQALGAIPATQVDSSDLTSQDRERIKWHRQPLQNPRRAN